MSRHGQRSYNAKDAGAPTWSGGGALLMGLGSATGVPTTVSWLIGGGGPEFGGTIASLRALWTGTAG